MTSLHDIELSRARIRLDTDLSGVNAGLLELGIPPKLVEQGVRHSLCMAACDNNNQTGVARLIADYATFACLMGLVVPDGYQSAGIVKALVGLLSPAV